MGRRLHIARLLATYLLLTIITGCGTTSQSGTSAASVTATVVAKKAGSAKRILIFSKTAGFRHASIPDGIAALRTLAKEHGVGIDASEDSTVFTDDHLKRYDAVVFLSTTGTILDEGQKEAFERYIRGGGGYAGVHSAVDTEYDWAWYGKLVGAYFKSHPYVQPATLHVEDTRHPSTSMLPQKWERSDEWYNFRTNPRSSTHVLITIDESSYEGGAMGKDHPVSWYHEFDGGRAWFTALGHTSESFREPLFLQHLWGGISYAAGWSRVG